MNLNAEIAKKFLGDPLSAIPTPIDLAIYCDPTYLRSKHLDMINKELVNAVNTPYSRTMFFMPPRHGKSLLATVYFSAWYMIHNPTKKVMVICYGEELAQTFGKQIRDILQIYGGSFGVKVSQDSRAVDEFTLEKGGHFLAKGIGGGLTGQGADILIIDDPHKNGEEASSKTIRDKIYRAYVSDIFTRKMGGAPIILTATRWDADDLAGRLLLQTEEHWKVLRLPAYAEENDPLGRKVGERLWPEKFDIEHYEGNRRLGLKDWSSLFQGRPYPEEGNIFMRKGLRTYKVSGEVDGLIYTLKQEEGNSVTYYEKDLHFKFITVDLASSLKHRADYTCIGVWAVSKIKDLILLDLVRRHIPAHQKLPTLWELWSKWNPGYIGVESTGFQLDFIQRGRSEGLPIRALKAKGTKEIRAQSGTDAASTLWETGKIYLPEKLPHLETIIEEIIGFPNAIHDDFVDMMTYACLEISRRGDYLESWGIIRCEKCQTPYERMKVCPNCGNQTPDWVEPIKKDEDKKPLDDEATIKRLTSIFPNRRSFGDQMMTRLQENFNPQRSISGNPLPR